MPSKGKLLALGAALLLGGGALLLSSPARRARLPMVQQRAQQALSQASCEQPPALSDADLIALLRTQPQDPCGHVEALAVERPVVLRWLGENALGEVVGPESLQLRAARVLMREHPEQTRPRVATELQRGRLGPESRQTLTQSLFLDLEGELPPDPTGLSPALAFARGDWSARGELASAIERELRWPTLRPPDSTAPPLRPLLVQSALQGLGLSPELLDEARARLLDGRPVQGLETESLMALQDHDSDCSEPDDACLAMLLELLEPELAPPPLTALAGVHTGDLPLFHALAESVAQAPDPAGRLLGLVAHPGHSYGPWAHALGQRGDPALALRYGGASPAASGLAALHLGEQAGVDVEVLLGETGAWVIRAGQRSARVGDCGPGASEPGALQLLDRAEVIDRAGWEQVAGLAQAGRVEEAISASRALPPLEASAGLRADLLACQGIRSPAQPHPGRAALWAQSCGQAALAQDLAQAAGTTLGDLMKQAEKQQKELSSSGGCGPSMSTLPPMFHDEPDSP